MSKKKGFAKPKPPKFYHIFRVEYKIFDPATGDEEDAENVLYEVPSTIGGAVHRRHYVAAHIACYFESEEAKQKGINLAFLWDDKDALHEPIGRLSSIPMPDAVTVDFHGLNARRGLKTLSKNVTKEAI